MPLKRARGRPRKYADHFAATTHMGQCLDATGEIFLRSEGRTGGPLDPYSTFPESVELLFSKPPKDHPMNDLLSKFSYSATPRSLNTVKDEEGAENVVKEELK
jgi:hypothetical protein